MAEKIVDARELSCPQPVILTRKALTEDTCGRVIALVSNPEQTSNIARMAEKIGWSADSRKTNDGYEIVLIKNTRSDLSSSKKQASSSCANAKEENTITKHKIAVFITSRYFGEGDDTLGAVLMRAFVKTLKEIEKTPEFLVFANSGVYLTTEGSALIDDLKDLENIGVKILSCGTCLDFFHLSNGLLVGNASNMYEIVSVLSEADRVMKI